MRLKTICTLVFALISLGAFCQIGPPPTGPIGPIDPVTPDPTLPTVEEPDPVGRLNGDLTVSLTGAVLYEVPIMVPKGSNGVEPKISLQYNSQGPRGIAGMGWGIAGGSTISRVPSTVYYDNKISAVDFSKNDRFAFDGQRLLLKSGTYGGDGAEYETENYTNIKITSRGVSPFGSNYGPKYFEVNYPDGSKAVYGKTTNSYSKMEYAINSWTDASGNSIVYSYIEKGGILLLSSIKYTSLLNQVAIPSPSIPFDGNNRNDSEDSFARETLSSNLDFTLPSFRLYENEINFTYSESGIKKEVYYTGGIKFENKNLLQSIEVKSGNEVFRTYYLKHKQEALGNHFLVQILEYNGIDDKPISSPLFDYREADFTTHKSREKSAVFTTGKNTGLTGEMTGSSYSALTGDFDGDGIVDFILYNKKQNEYWISYSTAPSDTDLVYKNNSGVRMGNIFPVQLKNSDGVILPHDGWAEVAGSTIRIKSLSNGVVKDEYSRTYNFPKFKQNPHPTNCNSSYLEFSFTRDYYSGDFDGDGLTDIITIQKPITFRIPRCSTTPPIRILEPFEMYFAGGSIDLLDYMQESSEPINKGFISDYEYNTKIVTGNFLGTSKTDLLAINSGFMTLYTYENGQFSEAFKYTNPNLRTTFQTHVGDFNGDGKTDIMFSSKEQGTKVFYSTGTSFEMLAVNGFDFYDKVSSDDPAYKKLFYGEYDSYLAVDFNADGKTDILHFKYLVRDQNYKDEKKHEHKKGGMFRSVSFIKSIGEGFEHVTSAAAGGSTIFPEHNIEITSSDIGVQFVPIPIYLGSRSHFKSFTDDDFRLGLFINGKIRDVSYRYNFSKNKLLTHVETAKDLYYNIVYAEYGVYSDRFDTSYTNFDFKPYMKYSNQMLAYPYMEPMALPNSWMVAHIRLIQNTKTILKKSFAYASPVFDARGLGFLGFKGIVSTNWYDKTENMYKNIKEFDITQRGALKKESVIEGSQWSAFIDPNLGQVGGTAVMRNYESISTYDYTSQLSANKVFKIQNTKSRTTNYAGFLSLIPSFVTETINTYNAYNDIVKQSVEYKTGAIRVGTTPLPNKIETVENTYAYSPSASNYYMSRLTSSKKTQTIPNEVDYVSEENFTYDAIGRVSKKTKKDNNASAIVEDNVYDIAGNIIKQTTSSNNLSRSMIFKFDNLNRFVTEVTDVEGKKTTYKHNLKKGLITEIIDYQGLATKYVYNNWGQQISETDYLGQLTKTEYVKNGKMTEITTSNGEGAWKKEYFDIWGNRTQVSVKNINGDLVHKNLEYDAYQRVVKESENYFGNTPQLWKITSYDKKDRVNKVIDAKGKVTTTTYSLDKIQVNDGISVKETIVNAAGNVVSRQDEGGLIKYKYFANGNLKSADYDGVVVTIEQDDWGRKTKLIDPSAGTYTYEYNALGDLVKETTPKGSTTFTLDGGGIITQKKITGDQTQTEINYTYDPTTKLLTQKQAVINGKNHLLDYTYDSYKRLKKTTETIPNAVFTKEITYDEFGREETTSLKAVAYGKTNETKIKNAYKNGYHWQVSDGLTHQVLVSKEGMNEFGFLTTIKLGNQMQINNAYDSYGFLKTNQVKINSVELFKLTNTFDVQRGTLLSRTNGLFNNYVETFGYDNLNRLTSFTNKTGIQETQVYDNRGRIESNAVGEYEYNDTNSYQLEAIDLNNEAKSYYQNRPEQQIAYNAFKSPVWIKEQGKENIYFDYGIDNQRSTMYYGNEAADQAQSSIRRHYSTDGLMEITYDVATNKVDFVTYVDGDAYSASVIAKGETTATSQFFYLHRDYLGSVLAISNSRGLILEKRHFDAWGNLVFVKDGQNNDLGTLTFFDRGYTGHEHLQGVALIHMNGRLYDPVLRRFLAPDNFMQDPSDTQNFNRYGYVLNNPLMYIDQNGEFLWIVPIITAAVFAVTNFAVQAFNGDIKNFWDGAKAFFSGAVVGFVLGTGFSAGLSVPILSVVIKGAVLIYGTVNTLSFTSGIVEGIRTGDWTRLGNAGKIAAGNFYLDSNRSVFGQIWQGFSRFAWELPQTVGGYGYSQINNALGGADVVKYFGGSTFVINENSSERDGISLGNYANIKIRGKLDKGEGRHGWMNGEDGLFWHEYGHSFQSQRFGLSYLIGVGIPSLNSAQKNSGEKHRGNSYEKQANRWAWRYANKYGYMKDWLYQDYQREK
jgi:RHS repeat-associated protein